VIEQLEDEAAKKAKAAELAIMKAKLAYTSIGSTSKKDPSSEDTAQIIAQTIALAQKEAESVTAEDRTERASVASPKAEERQGSGTSINDGLHDSVSKEVAAINEDSIEIMEPPTIVRQKELPPPEEDGSTSKGSHEEETMEKKELTVITDNSHQPQEDVISPLNNDGEEKSNPMGDTLETIYMKIEQCREIMMDPNTPMAEQASAVELMTKMAQVAKIAESLESKKITSAPSPKDLISPLSCCTGDIDDDKSLELDVSKSVVVSHVQDINAKIEQCRKALMDSTSKLSENL
jgi:hypothetical protein